MFYCRICAARLMRPNLSDDLGDNGILVTPCGHLFHRKCLDVSITRQKLEHATSGIGPFIKHCPAYKCGKEIPEGENIILLSTTEPKSSSGEEICDKIDEIESKLTRKVNTLSNEKEKLQQEINALKNETENFKEIIEEIQAECEEIATYLVDDDFLKKGDRVFWAMKGNMLAPGRIAEIRKSSSPSQNHRSSPFVIIKLDSKVTLPSLGAERETVVVPVTEIITFKSFFKDTFVEFRHKLWKILDESKNSKSDRRQNLLRSKFQGSSIRSLEFPDYLSGANEAVDVLPLTEVSQNIRLPSPNEGTRILKRSPKILRTRSMYFGMERSSDLLVQEVNETIRSTPRTLSDSWNGASQSLSSSFSLQSPTVSMSLQDKDMENESFISAGEKVIYYDPETKIPQTGVVSSILKYTPCAIVKMDQLPNQIVIFQYRTLPISQLFPYALSSAEEKLQIAESYGELHDFAQANSDDDAIINAELDDFMNLMQEEEEQTEEYFSSEETEDQIYVTIHHV